MNTTKQRLTYLFNCYYAKIATPAERDELFALIATECVSDEELGRIMQECWVNLEIDKSLFNTAKSDQILKTILNSAQQKSKQIKNNSSIILWTKLAAAAVVMFFLSVGVYQLLFTKTVEHHYAIKPASRPQHDALPGSNKAVLTLTNGKTIVLDNAQNGTLAKQGETVVNKTNDGQLVYNASIAGKADEPVAINTITTPRGGQYQIKLPDGTQVWLNSASSLKFPTRFSGDSRNVEITGEAYFEVFKNPLMPFKVKTSRAEIEVLGTHFNIMDYTDESVMKTTLLEGAVNVITGTSSKKLKPGQQAQIKTGGQTKVVDDVDVDDETAWKNGIFQFNDAGVDKILRQASRWYDVDVVYKGKVPDREFTGRISRNVKASELLNMLKYTGIDLKIEGKNIIVL
ncbi:hypothetical protein A0256_17895 [Mucilaginibacter sp. PAMC 26640]|nr:hypothetical protein A0256_17895 [Mucilaginibacter sp. PAMC 26640]